MPHGTRIDDDTRELIVSSLTAGQSSTAVARDFMLPYNSVQRIKEAVLAKEPPVGTLTNLSNFTNLPVEGEPQNDAVIRFISTSLAALTQQAIVASGPAYLRAYSPQQLAHLYGVMAEKVARILEAPTDFESTEGA